MKAMAGHRKEITKLIFTSPTALSIAPFTFLIRTRQTPGERQRRVSRRTAVFWFTVYPTASAHLDQLIACGTGLPAALSFLIQRSTRFGRQLPLWRRSNLDHRRRRQI